MKIDDKLKMLIEIVRQANVELVHSGNVAVQKFREGGNDLDFDQVKSLGSEYSEIAKGVFVKVSNVVSDKVIDLHCKMEEGSELLFHYHSDYHEFFNLKLGILFEKVTGKPKEKSFDFPAGVPHHLLAVKYSEMDIRCVLV